MGNFKLTRDTLPGRIRAAAALLVAVDAGRLDDASAILGVNAACDRRAGIACILAQQLASILRMDGTDVAGWAWQCDHTLADQDGGYACEVAAGHEGDHRAGDREWPTGWTGMLGDRWREDRQGTALIVTPPGEGDGADEWSWSPAEVSADVSADEAPP
jgi:hypothetical protein